MATATVDVIAPKVLILPANDTATGEKVSGALFVSGAELIRYNGTKFVKVTES